MPALSSTIILGFCKLCSWANTVWVIHRTLGKNLNDKAISGRFRCPYVINDISIITQEYVLLQIAKLHDPAVQNGKNNLTIEYVMRFGGWDENILSTLIELEKKLEDLKSKIFSARNKIICHNDLETILSEKLHGEFSKDQDIEYFKALQEFVNIIHGEVVGGSYILDDSMIKNDAETLSDILKGKIKPLFEHHQ